MTKLEVAYKLFIGLNILFFCEKLIAQVETDNTIQIRTIAVAPYGIESNKNRSGIYYDLANTLITESKLHSQHLIYPYARIISELKNGKTDLTIMFKYNELKEHVIYIAPLPSLHNIVIGLKGNRFESISDLEGKTIAYLRGARFSEAIDTNGKIKKHRTNDFRQSIKMLVRGRVDAIIGPMEPILSAADSIGMVNIFNDPLYVSQRTPWLQISKKSKLRFSVDDISDIFENILMRGELTTLKNKYRVLVE
jgi:polar amino acid transport system substrate-binding protein